VDMAVGGNSLKPVPPDRIVQRFQSLRLESKETQLAVVSALNLVAGPCEICDEKPLAHCAVEHGHACIVVDRLVDRAIGLAKSGMPVDQLKVAINYPDIWFPGMGEGVPVHMHLFTSDDTPFVEDIVQIQTEISDRFGDEVTWTVHRNDAQRQADLGVRAVPTWFVNGHRFRGLQSARTLGRFVAYELTVKAGE